MALRPFVTSSSAEAGGCRGRAPRSRTTARRHPRSAGAPTPGRPSCAASRAAPADLVPVLQRTQEALGYLSPDAVRRVARWLKLSESDVFGVATFYAQFRFSPPGRHRLRVCLGTACHVKGGVQMLETLERRLQVSAGRDHARRRVRPRARGLPGLLRARPRGDAWTRRSTDR